MSKKLVKAFEDIEKNKEVDYLDEYLASDTENEEDSLGSGDESDGSTKEAKIAKYKNLLKNIEEEEEKSKQEKKKFDIEIDWAPEMGRHGLDSDSDEFEMDEDEKEAKLKQEKRNKYRKSKKYKNAKKDEERPTNPELELIAMDDKKEKRHFNYENYVENSKKVGKEKKKEKVAKDEFKVCNFVIGFAFAFEL